MSFLRQENFPCAKNHVQEGCICGIAHFFGDSHVCDHETGQLVYVFACASLKRGACGFCIGTKRSLIAKCVARPSQPR